MAQYWCIEFIDSDMNQCWSPKVYNVCGYIIFFSLSENCFRLCWLQSPVSLKVVYITLECGRKSCIFVCLKHHIMSNLDIPAQIFSQAITTPLRLNSTSEQIKINQRTQVSLG